MNQLLVFRPDYDNLWKLRSNNFSPAMNKHEHIKLSILRLIGNKHVSKRHDHEVYTEYVLVGIGRKCDIIHINHKDKSVTAFEIQKEITKEWREQCNLDYENLKMGEYKVNWVEIPLLKISNDLEKMENQLKEYL